MFSLLSVALLAAAPAFADEEAAETCLRTKIHDGYTSGFQLRSQTNTSLAKTEYRIYLLELYTGNEYKFLACGDENAANLDMVLYDSQGAVLLRDSTADREPKIDFLPQVTGTYYLSVHATKVADLTKKAGVSTAVTYK